MNTVSKPEAVSQEFSCQNYLIIKVPDKKKIINIGTSAVIILCAAKLTPALLPALAAAGMGNGVLLVIGITAWLAKHLIGGK